MALAYQKTAIRTKIGGVLARGASQKNGTPYLFLQPLKLTTSNWYTTCVFDYVTKKQRFGLKMRGVWAKGASKTLGLPTYFCNR